ncbi:methionyl-tRNA synthetase [Thermosporothrix hazakensis]|jgi:methionyl-tRNA synthetase|uniref:Methionine--tRNA ligase n=1 Tax=Thermosporothrix hazakensis TaxID=644383 RepID=A0A326U9N3_THEHA|nr:methionine--tRNA ligase [Thermosporothrix hazakensis]PZW32926.1 methionyl-tRNA synthetase [Thermosporothrix hazakensis]GCE48958.1 methionine--tRNA ligase [Thermosporothrix hazakensis]
MAAQQKDEGCSTYYITTAIDYSNGKPHIGHALEKLAADVLARYHRLRGDDTLFSGGVDENSLHVLRAAQKAQVEPHQWIDEINRAFRLAWSKLDISYDRWIRTTEEVHVHASVEMFRRARANGDIYKSTYSGWYCPNCNTFYTAEELTDGHCPLHPSIMPEWLDEENYFFALSRYSDALREHIETHPEFIVPASRRAEVLGMLKQGLRDFSISRQVRPGFENWGIPVPDDPGQVLYVWFDALTNYLTVIGFPDDQQQFTHYWPANAHVIGKDITRFHCLYWPAMLLSAQLPLPRQVAVHGFLNPEGGEAFSKTAGNVVDPVELVDTVGVDAVRYYLLRNLSFASDSIFSRAGLLQAYNSELANDLGNLLNRVVSMIQRYRNGAIPNPGMEGPLEQEIQAQAQAVRQKAEQELEVWEIGRALQAAWGFVRRINQYIEQNEPWKLARQVDQTTRLDTVLFTAAESLRLLSVFLSPYIPTACQRIREQLGLPALERGAWETEGTWSARSLTQVQPGAVIFPRLEEERG